MTTAPLKEAVYERPWMYEAQLDAIFCPERYAVVEASTKSGKTVGCIVWLGEQAMAGRPGQNYWWVAPVYPQARVAFSRFRASLPRELYTSNETELRIHLANGTVIWFKSAEKPDNLYGEDVYACVIDEATRCREEAWHAIRSTLTATRGPVRIIGNVKGRKNWAYRLARRAESGEPGWHYSRITATDAVNAGVLDEDEIDEARRDLPADVFKQLYMAEPADDEGNPFGIDAIRACFAPVSDARSEVYGIDLAKSLDWTVIHGLDAGGYTSQWDRFQLPWEATTPRVEQAIGNTPAYVDSTGVGDPIVERLQKSRPQVEGFTFTGPSKQRLMEGLSVAIHNREVYFPEGVVSAELEAFEYEYTRTGVRYSAPEGLHDDCVMALALAVHGKSHRPGRGVW